MVAKSAFTNDGHEIVIETANLTAWSATNVPVANLPDAVFTAVQASGLGANDDWRHGRVMNYPDEVWFSFAAGTVTAPS